MSRATLLLVLVAAPAALLMACGSDSPSTTTSTGAGGGSTTATSTSGAGGATSAATGTGGDASTTATSTTGATSSATGSSSASGSTGTGMMMGACTNPTDLDTISMKDVKKIAEGCGKSNLGAEPGTKNCIKMGTGLSDPCVVCFDDIVQCVVKNCFNECFADPASQACTDCREAKCNPAFVTCSGLAPN